MTDRLEQLLQFHKDDPTDAFTAYGIALEYSKKADHQQALHWLDQTLQIDPAYCYAYYQKAKTLSETGNNNAARDVLHTGMQAAMKAGDNHAHEEMAELAESLA